jgi:DNA mismatch repair protein MutL
MFVDQRRAHERILFEEYMRLLHDNHAPAQQRLFPTTIHLDTPDLLVLEEIRSDVEKLGISLSLKENNQVEINGLPGNAGNTDPAALLHSLIDHYKISENDPSAKNREKIAAAMAAAAAIPHGKTLSGEEMRDLTDRLFGCSEPSYTPSGKPVFYILPGADLEKQFE